MIIKRNLFLLFLLSIIILALPAAAKVVIMPKFEEPEYTIIESNGDIEIREYKSRIIAQVLVDGDLKRAVGEGGNILTGYTYGKNIRIRKPSTDEDTAIDPKAPATIDDNLYRCESIAPTTPLTALQIKNDKWLISLFMPKSYTLDTLPQPDNKRIRFIELEPEKFAVIKCGGLASDKNLPKKTLELQNFLAQKKLKGSGCEIIAYYGPLRNVPFLRRSEIMIPLQNEY